MEVDNDPSFHSKSLSKKSETLRSLSQAQISTTISKVSSSSRVLPTEKDFHFFYNFNEFRTPIDNIISKSESMLRQIGSSKHLLGAKEINFPEDLVEDGYDWLVNVNDEIMERFDASIDEFSSSRGNESGGDAKGRSLVDEDGFQLVCGRRKKKDFEKGDRKEENSSSSGNVRVVERDEKSAGGKSKIPFHIPTIKRPQDEFSILVNNSNEPFQHVWLERNEDGSRVVHPLEKLSVHDFVDRNIECSEPQKPPPLESTPFKLVQDVQDLMELASKLNSVNEFAVDLEHNHYRSFQGLTCLMQISTRTEDFLVDTLKLRIHIGPYLREIFKDPAKRKVMHGADRDIVWLQRDFGIYICNLFDTGQASRVLQMERNSLEYLLQHFCEVTANKKYQNADWRLRPLPDEMIRYAREDTHFLLYIYDQMKVKLLSESTDPEISDALLLEVYKRSYDVCMQLYEKELLTDSSYLYIYGVQEANLNAQQLAIVADLCRWRDAVARKDDESTGYVLPNKMLLEIVKQMPLTTSKLRRLVRSKHPYVERNLSTIVNIIKHSAQKASSFEAVAEQLKEGRMQVPELNDTEADLDYSAAEVSDGTQHEDVPPGESGETKGHDLNMRNNDRGGASSDNKSKSDKMMKDDDCGTGNETNAISMQSGKVAQVTVQVLKKPNRAFGALLGSSVSKKKTDLKKEKEDKLQQIKSSVNLPFYSFSTITQKLDQSSKPASEDPNEAPSTSISAPKTCPSAPTLSTNTTTEEVGTCQNTPLPINRVTTQTSIAKLEDVILLDNDSLSNDDAPPDPHPDGSADQGTSLSEPLIPSEDNNNDNDDEPMSLSDLSSSFQKCLHPNHTTEKDAVSKGTCLKFKPFDYEAARREVKFGEDSKRKVDSGDNGKSTRKKKGGSGKSEQDGNGLGQGKRRQAFPASGNRSATFR